MSDLPSGRQVLTELEYCVVRKYCELEGKTVPSWEEVSLVRRDWNPVGFMTEVRIGGGAGFRWSSRVYDQLPAAKVGPAGDLVGFVIFFDSDEAIAIEGFVYDGKWPSSEHPIEFIA